MFFCERFEFFALPTYTLEKASKLKTDDYMDARYINERLPFAQKHSKLQKVYYFRPVEAARVIYLATPHQGAPMAQYSITGWLMGLGKNRTIRPLGARCPRNRRGGEAYFAGAPQKSGAPIKISCSPLWGSAGT